MTRTVLTEFRRGAGLAAMAGLAVAGAAMLFNETEDWAGRWLEFAEYTRVVLSLLAPVAVAVAAWHGGRDRRRRVEELISSTSRAPWQRVVTSWASVAVGAALGFALACLPGIVLVARVATYGGGLWWLLLVGSLAVVVASTAVGYAVGRLATGRVAAPAAGVLALGVFGLAGLLGPDVGHRPDGMYLPWSIQALQLGWFVALTATALALAGARRRWLAAVPGGVALAVAVPLVAAGAPGEAWRQDPGAAAAVCSGHEPEVCVSRENAFVLDDLVSAAGQALDRLRTVPGAAGITIMTTTSVLSSGVDGPHGEVYLTPYLSWDGSLSQREEGGGRLADDLLRAAIPHTYHCRSADDVANEFGEQPSEAEQRAAASADVLHETALRWAGSQSDPAGFIVADDGTEISMASLVEPVFERLEQLTAGEQRAWLSRYIEAATNCDDQALRTLAEELR